ncbi:uncharacterized protein LOC114516684 isoform X2 [Dendronephthya gigantea]|uniref:uncharacterized protein LOC114516684 isoform X2 n=1 Tax=Dendronephthya gigantea TaxID=151771 RepID=UPI00106905EF|nr:uncharacterized protein LOC114516684 isoform X2 [Dendronephthya gigantea]
MDTEETCCNCKCVAYFVLEFIHVGLIVTRIIALIIFLHFDTKCLIIEHGSSLDCEQEGLLDDSESWMFAWFILSMASAIFIIIIVLVDKEFHFVKSKARKVCKKGSFWSLTVLGLLTVAYYSVRVGKSPSKNKHISIALIFWPIAMYFVVIFLNYTPRVRFDKDKRGGRCPEDCCQCCTHCIDMPRECLPENCCNGDTECCRCTCCRGRTCCRGCTRSTCCTCCTCSACYTFCKNFGPFFIYWTSLIVFSIEIACIWLAIALDTAYDVAPLMESSYRDESSRGIVILLLGFRVSYHTRLLFFFWEKMFHGDKDLFSEPCPKLLSRCKPREEPRENPGDEPTPQPNSIAMEKFNENSSLLVQQNRRSQIR